MKSVIKTFKKFWNHENFGIGTDIVSIDRIKKSIKNKRFVKRIYNAKEISRCKKLIKSHNCFAKRFAAKEAFSKALGTGISNGINLNEIIVKNDVAGKPYLIFEGDTKKLLKNDQYWILLFL